MVEVPGITSTFYQVPSSGMTKQQRDEAMEETERFLKKGCEFLLGFQSCQGFRCPPCLEAPITGLNINGAGDPFNVTTPLSFRGKWIERNVLDYYASLWNAKWPHNPKDPETYWGYVTAGSAEGNIHAMWNARDHLSRCSQGSSKPYPVVFYSRDSNHSLRKAAGVTNLSPFDVVGSELYPNENPFGDKWEEGVPCVWGDAGSGCMDIDALAKLVDFFSAKGHPIVVIFNYGTTFKCACDDVQRAGEVLIPILKKNSMYEYKVQDPDNQNSFVMHKRFWFHVDGALSAAYMPFLQMAYKNGFTDINPGPIFDFRLHFISSIITSGHKWMGLPWPCGIYITKSGLINQLSRTVSVLNVTDAAISVSRNVHSTILLWSHISKNPYDKEVESVLKCLKLASYAVEKLKALEREIGIDLWVTYYEPSLAILFRSPNFKICIKYSLPTQTLCIEGQRRCYTHIYIMKHVTINLINSIIKDLQAKDSFSCED